MKENESSVMVHTFSKLNHWRLVNFFLPLFKLRHEDNIEILPRAVIAGIYRTDLELPI